MTDVGRITVGVDIDGGDLGAQIGAEVRAQLAPILAEIQREINATNKDLSSLDTTGLKGVTKEATNTSKATDGLSKSTDTLTKAEQSAEQQATRLSVARTAETVKTQAATKAHADYAQTLQQSTKAATNAFTSQLSEFQKAAQRAPIPVKFSPAQIAAEAEKARLELEKHKLEKKVQVSIDEKAADKRFEEFARRETARHLEVDVGVVPKMAEGQSGVAFQQQLNRYEQQVRDATQRGIEDGEKKANAGGGGRGGGGGRDVGGGGGGDFGKAASALLPFGAIGTAVFGAIGELPAAATASAAAIASVTGALVQLSGAAVAVPGLIAGVGATGGVAALGIIPLVGALKDAIKASDGTPASMKKAAQALTGLAQPAKDVVSTILGLKPAFDDLQKLDETNLFAGISTKVQTLADTLLPHLKDGIGSISTAINQDLGQVLDSLGSGQNVSLLDRIIGNTATADTKIKAAIDPIITAIGTIAAAGSDALPRIADGIAAVSTKFANFITQADKSGALDKFINDGITGVKELGDTFLNVGKILGDINTALTGGGTGGFLKSLDDGTTKLAAFLASAKGQTDLKNFFAEGARDGKQLFEVIKQLPGVFHGVVDAAHEIDTTVVPVFAAILKVLNAIPGGVQTVIEAILAFKAIKLAGSLIDGLAGITKSLRTDIPAAAAEGAAKTNAELDTIGKGRGGAAGGGSVFGRSGPIWGSDRLKGLAALGIPLALLASDSSAGGDQSGTSAGRFNALGQIATYGGIGAQIGGPEVGALAAAAAAIKELIPVLQQGFKDDADQRRNLGAGPEKDSPENGKPFFGIGNSFERGSDENVLTRSVQGVKQVDAATQDAAKHVAELGQDILKLPDGKVAFVQDTPEAIAKVEALGLKITTLPNGKVAIVLNTETAEAKLQAFLNSYQNAVINVNVAVPGSAPAPGGTPPSPLAAFAPTARALGGAIWGNLRGQDSVLIAGMPGEHMFDTTDVDLMGGQSGVYRFRSMLKAGLIKGFDTGGAVGGTGGAPVIPVGGDSFTSALEPLIAAVNEVRDAVLATNPNASASAQSAAVAAGKLNTSGIPTIAGLPTTTTAAGLPLTAQQQQNKNLTTALKPLTTTIDDAIKKGVLTDPNAPVDQDLLATRNAALGRNQGAIDASGPANSQQQADFIQKDILDPLAAALNATAKKNAPSANLPKVGVASNDPVVLAILSLREALVGGEVPLSTTGTGRRGTKQTANITNGVPIDPNTGLPIPGAVAPGALAPGQTGVGPTGEPVDQNGIPLSDIGTRLLNGAIQGLGGSVSTFGKTGLSALNQSTNFPLPPSVTSAPSATVQQLVNQNNPEAIAAALGYNVPDLGVQGGTPQSGLTKNTGPQFDASGQLYSDTSALTNRTYTDAVATQNAEIKQLQDVMNQVKDQLTSQVLEPIMEEAVTKGISAMSSAAQKNIGLGVGSGAAPDIATAVATAIQDSNVTGNSNSSSDTGATSGVESAIGNFLGDQQGSSTGIGNVLGLFDEGGVMPTHTIGMNLSGSPERVLSPTQTSLFDSGLLGGWNLQPMQQHMGEAVGEGQAGGANATVGADFFGASQIPVLGAIINFLIETLLSVIGVTVTATSTLDNMSTEVRKFRGQFQAFNAEGQLTNDTSGLLDRSDSSEQAVEDQRLRILQQVIQGIVKFIIDDIIGPVVKAVGDAAVNAGGSAAGGALDTVAPGAGGIVSSLISSAGDAGVGIGVSIGTNAGESAASTLLSSLFGIVSDNSSPGVTSVLGGNLLGGLLGGSGSGSTTSNLSGILGSVLDLGGLLGGPSGNGGIGSLLSSLLGGLSGTGGSGGLLGGLLGGSGVGSIFNLLTGGILGAFTSLFSGVGGAFGLSGLLNGLTSFDEGGVASGMGMMPKATIKPERVLSPAQTQSFDRLVDALGAHGGSSSTTTVHAPISLQGTSATPEAVRDRLLALMS